MDDAAQMLLAIAGQLVRARKLSNVAEELSGELATLTGMGRSRSENHLGAPGEHRLHRPRLFLPLGSCNAGRLLRFSPPLASGIRSHFTWALITLMTAVSARVVVSPTSRPSATSRRRRRMILPERVFGSSPTM